MSEGADYAAHWAFCAFLDYLRAPGRHMTPADVAARATPMRYHDAHATAALITGCGMRVPSEDI